MKKKIIALCSVIIALSICFTAFSVMDVRDGDVTVATMKNYCAPKAETTAGSGLGDILGGIGSDSSGGLGDILGGVDTSGLGDTVGGFGDILGGIGDSFGGVGDALGGAMGGAGEALGGILGGVGNIGGDSGTASTTVGSTVTVTTTSADIGLIIPVPAATQTTEAETTTEATTAGETVDYAATSNPYTKPTDTFSAGDEDETIKWLQWIFIYTGYGLSDNGITGVLDEDTVAIVKKLQKENKLTVDGNITEDVIKAAEVLYYQSILGGDVSAIEVSSDATTGESVSSPAVGEEKSNSVPGILLIVILVILWVFVIGGIIVLFVVKKNKKKKVKDAAPDKEENKKSEVVKKDDGKTEIKSLSDLFEEAENKDK